MQELLDHFVALDIVAAAALVVERLAVAAKPCSIGQTTGLARALEPLCGTLGHGDIARAGFGAQVDLVQLAFHGELLARLDA